jgi:hypothetical protein
MEKTPTPIPSNVRLDRSLFTRMALIAILKLSCICMAFSKDEGRIMNYEEEVMVLLY